MLGFVRRNTLAVSAALITAAVAGGIAYAAVPDSTGVITGCRNTTSGALRAIDTAVVTTCQTGEATVKWNANGAHFASIDANGGVRAASDSVVQTFHWTTGRMFVYFPTTINLDKCGITATAEISDYNVAQPLVTAINRYGYGYVFVTINRLNANGTATLVDAPIDINVDCAKF